MFQKCINWNAPIYHWNTLFREHCGKNMTKYLPQRIKHHATETLHLWLDRMVVPSRCYGTRMSWTKGFCIILSEPQSKDKVYTLTFISDIPSPLLGLISVLIMFSKVLINESELKPLMRHVHLGPQLLSLHTFYAYISVCTNFSSLIHSQKQKRPFIKVKDYICFKNKQTITGPHERACCFLKRFGRSRHQTTNIRFMPLICYRHMLLMVRYSRLIICR